MTEGEREANKQRQTELVHEHNAQAAHKNSAHDAYPLKGAEPPNGNHFEARD